MTSEGNKDTNLLHTNNESAAKVSVWVDSYESGNDGKVLFKKKKLGWTQYWWCANLEDDLFSEEDFDDKLTCNIKAGIPNSWTLLDRQLILEVFIS